MADKYWVSTGNANWATAANWRTSSGGGTSTTVPTAADNVFFDGNSGTAIVTIAAAATCLSFNVSTWGGTLAGTSTLAISNATSLDGSGTFTYSGTVTFNATTSATGFVGSNSSTDFLARNNVVFNGVGGSWDVYNMPVNTAVKATRTITLTAGSIIIRVGAVIETGTFSSSGTGVRSISADTGGTYIYLFGRSGTVLNFATITNLTHDNTFPITYYTSNSTGTAMTGTRTFTCSSSFTEANAPYLGIGADGGTVTITAGSYGNLLLYDAGTGNFATTLTNTLLTIYTGVTIYGSHWTLTGGANSWSFANTSGYPAASIYNDGTLVWDWPLVFSGGGTYTVYSVIQGSTRSTTFSAGTISIQSSFTVGSFVTSGVSLKYLNADPPGTQATISDAGGTNTVTYLNITDSAATGGATWTATAASNVDGGNNTGWTFPAGNVTVTLTGVSATGTTGNESVTGNGLVTLTGIGRTTAVGTVTVALGAVVTVTKVTGTTSLGTTTVTAGGTVTTTNVTGTTSIGTVTIINAGNISFPVTGVSATSALGTITVTVISSITFTVTSVVGTGSIGTVTPSGGSNVTVIGLSATSSLGTAIASIPITITVAGVQATSSLGTVSVIANALINLSGVVGYGRVGTVNVWANIVPTDVSDWADVNTLQV